MFTDLIVKKGEFMRFHFSGGIFWGSILILVGILLLIKNYTNISIPIFRIIFGLFFIYMGFNILFGGVRKSKGSDVIFNEREFKVTELKDEYNVVFGRGVIDLRDIEIPDTTKYIQVDVVFGVGIIKLNKNTPILVKLSTAFGAVEAPGRSVGFIGDNIYKTESYKEGENCIKIKAEAVFGHIQIEVE